MMLMRWDVSLDLNASKDGAHFMFLGWRSIVLDHERQRSGRRLTLTGLWSFSL